MKLSSEEIKKVVLSAMMFLVLIYGYNNFLLDDLNKSEKNAVAKIARLKPDLAKAEDQIRQAVHLKEQAPLEGEMLEKIKALIPKGEPVAWFPPRITDFFKRQGIERSSIRMGGAPVGDNLIPGFKRVGWVIDLPKVEYAKLGIAIAGLENEEPLMEINNLNLDQRPDSIEFHHAILNISIIVKDEKR